MKRKRWASILAIFLTSQSCFATAVVILRKGNTIWIAADSLQTNRTGGITRLACKVMNGGQFWWAAAGPVYSDPATGFEVSAQVDAVKSKRGAIKSKMNSFVSNSKPAFVAELKSIKSRDPIGFAKVMGYHCLIQIAFAGIERGRATFVWTCMTAIEADGQIMISGTPDEAPLKGDPLADMVLLGETTEAASYIRKHKSELNGDPIAVIRQSIVYQESAEPQMVGGEVSILELSSSGAKWVDKGECK